MSEIELQEFLDFNLDQLQDQEYVNEKYHELISSAEQRTTIFSTWGADPGRQQGTSERERTHAAKAAILEQSTAESLQDQVTTGLVDQQLEASTMERLDRLSRQLYALISSANYSFEDVEFRRSMILEKVHLAIQKQRQKLSASGYSARPAAGQVQPMLKLGILSFSRMLFALVEDSSNQNPALCQLALSFLKEQLDELPALSVAPNVKMDAAEVSMQAMDSAANFLVRLAGRQESPELTKMAIEMLLGMAVSRGSLRYFVNVMDLLVRLALSPGPLSELKFNAVSYINKLSSVKQFQSFLPPSDKSFAGTIRFRRWGAATHVAITVDGVGYMYIHSPEGLFKIGTGLLGTTQGKVYVSIPKYRAKEQGRLFFVADKLLYRSWKIFPASFLVLDPFSLQETGAILADGTGTAPSADNSSCIFGPEFPLPKKKPVESEGVPSPNPAGRSGAFQFPAAATIQPVFRFGQGPSPPVTLPESAAVAGSSSTIFPTFDEWLESEGIDLSDGGMDMFGDSDYPSSDEGLSDPEFERVTRARYERAKLEWEAKQGILDEDEEEDGVKPPVHFKPFVAMGTDGRNLLSVVCRNSSKKPVQGDEQTGSPAVEDSSPSLAASSSRVASSSAAQSSAAVSATPDGEDDEAPQEGVETEVFASVFSEEENFREVKRVKLLGPTYENAMGSLRISAGGYMSLGNPEALNFSGNITIECWIRVPSVDSVANGYIFNHGNASTNIMYLQLSYGSITLSAQTAGGTLSSYLSYYMSGHANQWFHLAVVYDSSQWLLYKDGALVTQQPGNVGAVRTNSESWYVGSSDFGSYTLNGEIADFRIWKTARSANEISSNYKRSLTGNEKHLVAYYKMNEGSGLTCWNWAGNYAHGRLSKLSWCNEGPIEYSSSDSSSSGAHIVERPCMLSDSILRNSCIVGNGETLGVYLNGSAVGSLYGGVSSPIFQVYDLETGKMVSETVCTHGELGETLTFDRVNNLLWSAKASMGSLAKYRMLGKGSALKRTKESEDSFPSMGNTILGLKEYSVTKETPVSEPLSIQVILASVAAHLDNFAAGHSTASEDILATSTLCEPLLIDLNPGTFEAFVSILEQLVHMYLDPSRLDTIPDTRAFLFSLLYIVRSIRTNLLYLMHWNLNPDTECSLKLEAEEGLLERIRGQLNLLLDTRPTHSAALLAADLIQSTACEALASGISIFYPTSESQRDLVLSLLHEVLLDSEVPQLGTPRSALLLAVIKKLTETSALLKMLPSLFDLGSEGQADAGGASTQQNSRDDLLECLLEILAAEDAIFVKTNEARETVRGERADLFHNLRLFLSNTQKTMISQIYSNMLEKKALLQAKEDEKQPKVYARKCRIWEAEEETCVRFGCRLMEKASGVFLSTNEFLTNDPSRLEMVDTNFQDKRCTLSSLVPAFLNGLFNLEYSDKAIGTILPSMLELLRCVNELASLFPAVLEAEKKLSSPSLVTLMDVKVSESRHNLTSNDSHSHTLVFAPNSTNTFVFDPKSLDMAGHSLSVTDGKTGALLLPEVLTNINIKKFTTPFVAVCPSGVVTFTLSPNYMGYFSNYFGYRCTVTASVQSNVVENNWMLDILQSTGLLCGKLVGQIIPGPAVSEVEKQCSEWLLSDLLTEGLESQGTEFDELRWLPSMLEIEERANLQGPRDVEGDAFLEDLIMDQGGASALSRRLIALHKPGLLGAQTKAPEAVLQAMRAVLAVVLKQNGLVNEAVSWTFADHSADPTDYTIRAWKTACKLPRWLMQRYQQARSKMTEEEEKITPAALYEKICNRIVKRCKFMLRIVPNERAISTPATPSVVSKKVELTEAQRKARSVAMAWKTLGAAGDMGMDRFGQLWKLVVHFAGSDVSLKKLESAIQRRKHRAIIRSAGLRAMEVALKSVSFPSVKREILRSLIPSLQFSEDLSLDATPRVVNHLESAGADLTMLVKESFLGLYYALMDVLRQPEESGSQLVSATLHAFNVDFKNESDIFIQMEIFPTLRSLLLEARESAFGGELDYQKAAWLLFDILMSRIVRQEQPQETSDHLDRTSSLSSQHQSDVVEPIFDILIDQLELMSRELVVETAEALEKAARTRAEVVSQQEATSSADPSSSLSTSQDVLTATEELAICRRLFPPATIQMLQMDGILDSECESVRITVDGFVQEMMAQRHPNPPTLDDILQWIQGEEGGEIYFDFSEVGQDGREAVMELVAHRVGLLRQYRATRRGETLQNAASAPAQPTQLTANSIAVEEEQEKNRKQSKLFVRMKVLSLLYAASNWPVAMAKLLESKSLQSLLRILKNGTFRLSMVAHRILSSMLSSVRDPCSLDDIIVEEFPDMEDITSSGAKLPVLLLRLIGSAQIGFAIEGAGENSDFLKNLQNRGQLAQLFVNSENASSLRFLAQETTSLARLLLQFEQWRPVVVPILLQYAGMAHSFTQLEDIEALDQKGWIDFSAALASLAVLGGELDSISTGSRCLRISNKSVGTVVDALPCTVGDVKVVRDGESNYSVVGKADLLPLPRHLPSEKVAQEFYQDLLAILVPLLNNVNVANYGLPPPMSSTLACLKMQLHLMALRSTVCLLSFPFAVEELVSKYWDVMSSLMKFGVETPWNGGPGGTQLTVEMDDYLMGLQASLIRAAFEVKHTTVKKIVLQFAAPCLSLDDHSAVYEAHFTSLGGSIHPKKPLPASELAYVPYNFRSLVDEGAFSVESLVDKVAIVYATQDFEDLVSEVLKLGVRAILIVPLQESPLPKSLLSAEPSTEPVPPVMRIRKDIANALLSIINVSNPLEDYARSLIPYFGESEERVYPEEYILKALEKSAFDPSTALTWLEYNYELLLEEEELSKAMAQEAASDSGVFKREREVAGNVSKSKFSLHQLYNDKTNFLQEAASSNKDDMPNPSWLPMYSDTTESLLITLFTGQQSCMVRYARHALIAILSNWVDSVSIMQLGSKASIVKLIRMVFATDTLFLSYPNQSWKERTLETLTNVIASEPVDKTDTLRHTLISSIQEHLDEVGKEENSNIKVFESAHPYTTTSQNFTLHFPGASLITVSFDPRCNINYSHTLTFYQSSERTLCLGSFTGGPGSYYDLTISGDTLYAVFSAEVQTATNWGFKVTCTADSGSSQWNHNLEPTHLSVVDVASLLLRKHNLKLPLDLLLGLLRGLVNTNQATSKKMMQLCTNFFHRFEEFDFSAPEAPSIKRDIAILVVRMSGELEKMRKKNTASAWSGQGGGSSDVATASMSALFELVLASRLALRNDGAIDLMAIMEELDSGAAYSSSQAGPSDVGGKSAADLYDSDSDESDDESGDEKPPANPFDMFGSVLTNPEFQGNFMQQFIAAATAAQKKSEEGTEKGASSSKEDRVQKRTVLDLTEEQQNQYIHGREGRARPKMMSISQNLPGSYPKHVVAVTNDWNSRVVLVDTNLSKGKWYWEAKITNLSGSCSLGVIIQGFLSSEAYSGIGCDPRGCSWGMQGPSGSVFYKGAAQSSSYWVCPCTVGMAFDIEEKTLTYYLLSSGSKTPLTFVQKNVASTAGFHPALHVSGTVTVAMNFGAKRFRMPIPDGFLPVEHPFCHNVRSSSWVDSMVENYDTLRAVFSREPLPEDLVDRCLEKEALPRELPLKLIPVSCSAPVQQETMSLSNMVQDDTLVTTLSSSRNVHVIFTAEEDSEFLLTEVTIRVPVYGSNPANTGMVFVTSEKPEFDAFSWCDDYKQDRYEKFVERKQALGQAWRPHEPVAFFNLQSTSSTTARLSVPRQGRYVVLKFLEPRMAYSNFVDIEFVKFAAIPGSHPLGGMFQSPHLQEQAMIMREELKFFMNVDETWTSKHDQELVELAQMFGDRWGIALESLDVFMLKPNREDLMRFTALQKVTRVETLRARLAVVKKLNAAVAPLLRYSTLKDNKKATEDCNVSMGAYILRLKNALFFNTKKTMWEAALNATLSNQARMGYLNQLRVSINRMKASRAKDDPTKDPEGLMSNFGQLYTGIKSGTPDHFQANHQLWNVEYVGEGSIDVGGPYRESITLACQDLMSSATPLFVQAPNGRHGLGINREKWLPNPACTSPLFLDMYRVVGILMGVSLRSKASLSLDLPPFVWKKILDETVDVEDLEAVDKLCIQALEELKKIEETAFGDVFMENFCTPLSNGVVVELKPNGKNTPVTFDTKEEFARLVVSTRLTESDRQIEAIRSGLKSVVPFEMLKLFSWSQLDLMVCGKPDVDVATLKRHTKYSGISATNSTVQYMWRALESFTPEERCLFLRFVWGRNRMPATDADWDSPFTINKFGGETSDGTLPVAHTCFFSLDLPQWSSFEVTRERLLFAIVNCQAIDTDFNPNSAAWVDVED